MVVSVGSGTNDSSDGMMAASVDTFVGMASMAALASDGIHDRLVGCGINDRFEGGCDEHRH